MRVIGFNDDQTHCDRCGKLELRGTVIVASEDADGNVWGEFGRYGTTCVSYVLGGRKITRNKAKTIEDARRSFFLSALRSIDRHIDGGDVGTARFMLDRVHVEYDVHRDDEFTRIATLREKIAA